jgi:BirA family transcriptional regulator, biotin operon repressor / biotin---[acetyl-CoA-carboxylase] ligase
MVNKENINIKDQLILRLFKADGRTLSGVQLSNELGMSRVAVWKHITALKATGVDIDSGPKGYTLSNPEDLLFPFCFKPKLQNRIFHFQAVDTTMDKARALAKSGAEHLSLVIAENQTCGRGRLNRKWISAKGGLWVTLILKPQTPPPLSFLYNFAASLSLSTILQHLFDLDIKVKWPNDLLLNGRKLAGLLSEMETRGDMVEFINIGIGLNVNNHPRQDEFDAISLAEALSHTVSRRQILETFLEDFQERINTLDPAGIITAWKTRTSTIGSQVRVETPGRIYAGLAVDVDESGALIIQDNNADTGNNTTQKIIYGDCFHT